ncbi:hypothetical protein T265_10989 [Opisthorchis viverrini]|uniref:ATP-binding cassette transporter n=1 Tax=Opisthorchis viverrini TaxID=6198 RepID=A0A074Z0J2_OPIVI|nr:hypothetical protein T265_10989 [Opisthorchis viverrini]KER20468.1 hypothetical protein T265_10989 [Opisthorchis viverrini]
MTEYQLALWEKKLAKHQLLVFDNVLPGCCLLYAFSYLRTSVSLEVILLSSITQPTSSKHWISDRTTSLLETRSPPKLHRRIIRRQVNLSVRADREAWWARKVEEMEDAKNAGNVRKLFYLIRSTGPRKPLVSEIIRDQNGSLICNKAERLDQTWPSTESWTAKIEPPSVSEVSDDPPPALFKNGGGFLSHRRQVMHVIPQIYHVLQISSHPIISPSFEIRKCLLRTTRLADLSTWPMIYNPGITKRTKKTYNPISFSFQLVPSTRLK